MDDVAASWYEPEFGYVLADTNYNQSELSPSPKNLKVSDKIVCSICNLFNNVIGEIYESSQ
jgi:hypothetical protein